jgi:hypothetical protein
LLKDLKSAKSLHEKVSLSASKKKNQSSEKKPIIVESKPTVATVVSTSPEK